MEDLIKIYDAIIANELTYYFCMVIVCWLAIVSFFAFIPKLASKLIVSKLVAITPNCLSTLGVLGTFTGILLGLLEFDVTDIDASVPKLLTGLKVAFSTSIVGIAAAILFRLVRVITPQTTATQGVTPEDIHQVLSDIKDERKAASELLSKQLSELRSAISSDGDSSLLTQIQKLRTTLGDGQKELIEEFRAFAKHMVENTHKALIEALEGVIKDFNKNLTEQFGENFKQLNEAVKSLVDWQDKYREHVEALEERLDIATKSVESTQRALEQVQSHSERIPETIKQLEPALSSINLQTDILNKHLESIAELREKALKAFPVVDENLEKMTTKFSASVEHLMDKSSSALSNAENLHKKLQEQHASFIKDAEDSRERFSTNLSETMKGLSEQTSREFAMHGELIESAAKEAQKSINDSWAQSVQKLNEQFESFDNQMQQELNRSLELMGKNLASISEKLASDYGRLAEQIGRLSNA